MKLRDRGGGCRSPFGVRSLGFGAPVVRTHDVGKPSRFARLLRAKRGRFACAAFHRSPFGQSSVSVRIAREAF
jgi:hypothetical protein